MSEPLRIALAGLGTVGGGVIRLIETNADLIARRAGGGSRSSPWPRVIAARIAASISRAMPGKTT
jgi:homoserine dehydrogenase